MQISDLEAMFEKLSRQGWDAIDNEGVDARKATSDAQLVAKRQRAEEAKIIAKALGDEDGLAAFQLLMKKTILRSTSDEERAARSNPMHWAILKATRDGQNDVIVMIMNMLREAKGEKDQQGGTEP